MVVRTKDKKIEIHLHGYANRISCPYTSEAVLFLSRNKVELDQNELDIKYYYNCSLAEECKNRECVFRKGYAKYEERMLERTEVLG